MVFSLNNAKKTKLSIRSKEEDKKFCKKALRLKIYKEKMKRMGVFA